MRCNPPGWGAILVSTSGEKRPSPDSVGLALTLGSRYGMVAPREGLARHILEDKRYTPEERSHIVRGGLAAAASWAASDQLQYGPAQALLEAVLSASPGALALGTLGDLALARDTDAEKPYAHILMSQGPSIESHIAEIAERGFKTTAVGPHLKQARLGAIYHYYHAIGNAKTLTVGQKAQIICAKYGSPPLTAAQTALAANDYEALAVMAEAILCTGLPKSEQQIFLKQAGVDLNAILAHLRGKSAHALQYKTLHQAQKGGKPPGPMNPVKYEQTSEAMVLNTLRVRIMAEPSLKPPASTIPAQKPRSESQSAQSTQPLRRPDTKSTPPPRSTNPSDFEREFAKYGEKYADLHQAMESAISSGELDLADVDAGDVARVPLPLWRAYAKAIKAAGGRLTQINLPSGGATGSPENANLKKLVPDLAREFPRVQIWADENDGPLQAYIDRLSGRGPEAPPVERPLDETGLDTKSSVVVRPAPALTPMQIYDETLATLRGIKDHRKQCTELRQRIRPVFMAALTDSSRACEAAAILSAVVETSPTADATQGRLLGALGLTSKTADVVLIALHDSQHPEAPNWSIRLQGQQRMVHAALSKDKNTTVSESGRQGPAQRPDHKRASQPPRTVATPARPADIVVSPAQVLDYARSLGYGTGDEIFVPGDPDVKPHLHITKDFVSLKKRNGTHYDLYDHNGAHPERLVLAASQLSPHVDLDRQILEILDFMQGIPSPAQPR